MSDKPRMGRPTRSGGTSVTRGVRLAPNELEQLAYLAEQWECTESEAIRLAIASMSLLLNSSNSVQPVQGCSTTTLLNMLYKCGLHDPRAFDLYNELRSREHEGAILASAADKTRATRRR